MLAQTSVMGGACHAVVLIAAAAAVYFGCLLLFRNDTVMELLHKGLERLQNR